MPEEFHVCVSYSRKDIEYVSAVVAALETANVHVFWDKNEEAALWGTNLRRKLAFIYQQAKYCVVFHSAAYQKSVWTQYELGHAGMRALHEESLLVARLDDTPMPLELSTLVWIDVGERSPETIAELIVAKVKDEEVRPRERTRWQKIKDYVRYRVWRIAAVLALLIALAAGVAERYRPSHTSVAFERAANTIVVRVENSGRRPSELVGGRLKFKRVPLKETELAVVRNEPSHVERGKGERNLLPVKLELFRTRPIKKEEVIDQLASGEVTLEIDVKESNETEPRRRPLEPLPAEKMKPFIEKWVPDVQ
ncbi:MAG TPA: toll/interleukin-1 receptor domain-containing protein [Thermoanaerobaculia bacterium]|jgi:hypothetical protein|nr:toll/interleukin-1 receptor domain-containing protein [Thermoanaerobaculia bacterium]